MLLAIGFCHGSLRVLVRLGDMLSSEVLAKMSSRLVDLWVRHHIDHCACVRVAQLFDGRVGLYIA